MRTKDVIFCLMALVTLQNCCLYGDCEDDNDSFDYSQYEPVYLSRADLENSVQLQEPKGITNSGKIYVKDNLLFVGEQREGFHVFDNSDPSNPIKVKFLAVPGASDLAVRNNVVYINQATDLITARFDLTQNEFLVTKRVENTFPVLYSPDGFYPFDVPENNIVVNWILKN